MFTTTSVGWGEKSRIGNNFRDEIKIRYLIKHPDTNTKNETYPIFLLHCLNIFLFSLGFPFLLCFCDLLENKIKNHKKTEKETMTLESVVSAKLDKKTSFVSIASPSGL